MATHRTLSVQHTISAEMLAIPHSSRRRYPQLRSWPQGWRLRISPISRPRGRIGSPCHRLKTRHSTLASPRIFGVSFAGLHHCYWGPPKQAIWPLRPLGKGPFPGESLISGVSVSGHPRLAEKGSTHWRCSFERTEGGTTREALDTRHTPAKQERRRHRDVPRGPPVHV